MRSVASADRVPASLLPACDKSSEEENERSELEPGKQSVVGPGRFRQEKVDIGGSPSVHVEVHVPRREEDKGHARQAEPENKQERKQEGLEREIPPPFVGAPDASLFENTVFQGIEAFDPETVAPGHGRVALWSTDAS